MFFLGSGNEKENSRPKQSPQHFKFSWEFQARSSTRLVLWLNLADAL